MIRINLTLAHAGGRVQPLDIPNGTTVARLFANHGLTAETHTCRINGRQAGMGDVIPSGAAVTISASKLAGGI